MDLGIKGKVAVVTASSKGLGRAVTEALAAEGVNLAICSRNEEQILTAAKNIRAEYNVEVLPVICDVTKQDDIEKLKKRVIKMYGTCHILFTNSGGPAAGKLDNFSSKDFQTAIDLNLMSTINLVYTFLPFMKKQKWGRIIASTSSNIRRLLPQFPLSNVSRNSVVAFIKTVALEVAHLGITANILAPGWFLTDPTKEFIENKAKEESVSYNEMLTKVSSTIPSKIIGNPKDFGALAAYLTSVQASYITGETFLIDGGVDGSVI